MTAIKPFPLLCAALFAVACDSSGSEMISGDTSGGTDTDVASSTTAAEPNTSSTSDVLGTSTSDSGSGGAAESSSESGVESSTSTGAATTSGDSGVEGDVVIEVSYEGALEGTLTVALFAACPPAGPPGAFVQEPAPTFPQAVELAGTTFVAGDMPCAIGYIDTGAPSPTSPGDEDPSGEVTFEIEAGAPTNVSLLLEDPA